MNKKSRVINIVVNDIDVFIECLIRELIRCDISYVQIDNEFHFLDHIYRFYDYYRDANFIKVFLVDDNNSIIKMRNACDEMFSSINDHLLDEMLSPSLNSFSIYAKKDSYDRENYKNNQKRLIKKNNRAVNSLLRNNKYIK